MSLDTALNGARHGDEECFRQLWRHFQPRLLRYLRVLAGQGAEDLASETWLRVVRDLRSFRGDEASFSAWLFTIARNASVDAQRRHARRPEAVVELNEELAPPFSNHPAAEDVALGALSTDAALALLAGLPVQQRDAVALTVLGGLGAAEAALILRTTPGAVRVRVHRGLRRLEAQLSMTGQVLSA